MDSVNLEKQIDSQSPNFCTQQPYNVDAPHLTRKSSNNGHAQEVSQASISERRLLTKIDLRILPVLSILYTLTFLDRTNIANATVFGLAQDLGLKGHQYQTALMIFFVPYIVLEIPSNLMLKRLKPHIWLSICTFIFGLVTICQGLVSNWAGLMVVRFMLGVFETGLYPGCFYLISMWYRRHEAQKRFTFFFGSSSLAGAFGGLLASAIGKMDGICGYKGWRWIFILEGLLTCVFSVSCLFIVPDFPEETKWLSRAEAEAVASRLEEDQGRSGRDDKITLRDVARCFRDFKIFLGGFMYLGLIVPAYGYAYFAPTIIRSYGYSPIQTQLYSVPPWVVAFIASMVVATCSDFLRHRFLFAIIPICIAIVGFSILLVVHHNRRVQYGALFLVVSGFYSAIAIVICWFQMNLAGHRRRLVGTAWQISFGNLGGIVATFIYPSSDAVNYFHLGYSTSIGFACLGATACIAYFATIWVQNRNKDKAGVDGDTNIHEGDLASDYRYLF